MMKLAFDFICLRASTSFSVGDFDKCILVIILKELLNIIEYILLSFNVNIIEMHIFSPNCHFRVKSVID